MFHTKHEEIRKRFNVVTTAKVMNMDNMNFVEIAQLISSLAMFVSIIYLAKQISEKKIAKKWCLGSTFLIDSISNIFNLPKMETSLNFSLRIGVRKALMITNIGE